MVTYQAVGKATRASTLECSTGVPWRLANGTRGFLTSGQCLPANSRSGAQVIKSKSIINWTAGARLGTRAASMTTVNASGTIAGKTGDLAFVASKLPVQNYLFTGGPTGKGLTRITSWASKATPGYYTLCFSGAQTGVQCGLKQGKGTSYNYGKVKYRGLAEGYHTVRGDARCPKPGDSGGVVYRMSPDGRSAYVMGIISGSQNTFLGCSMFYTPLGAAQKQFGGGPIIR